MKNFVQGKNRSPTGDELASINGGSVFAIEDQIKQLLSPIRGEAARGLRQARTLTALSQAFARAVEVFNEMKAQQFTSPGSQFTDSTGRIRGRIAVSEEIAVVNLTYLSSRTSADDLCEFWQRLGNVLQRHKRITFLRNKKVGLQLHFPTEQAEEQLRGLADRAASEATVVLDSVAKAHSLQKQSGVVQ